MRESHWPYWIAWQTAAVMKSGDSYLPECRCYIWTVIRMFSFWDYTAFKIHNVLVMHGYHGKTCFFFRIMDHCACVWFFSLKKILLERCVLKTGLSDVTWRLNYFIKKLKLLDKGKLWSWKPELQESVSYMLFLRYWWSFGHVKLRFGTVCKCVKSF